MRRGIVTCIAAFSILAAVILLGAFVPGPLGKRAETGSKTERIWLLFGPIHTDIAVPINDTTRAHLPFLPSGTPDGYALIGWGSRAFYTSTGGYTDLRLSTVVTAATGDSAVLRLLTLPDTIRPLETWGARALPLTPAQQTQLLTTLADSVTGPAIQGVHLAPRDHFFPAKGRFHLGHTCNQWVNARLREIGVPLGVFTPTKLGLRWSLKWFNACSDPNSCA